MDKKRTTNEFYEDFKAMYALVTVNAGETSSLVVSYTARPAKTPDGSSVTNRP